MKNALLLIVMIWFVGSGQLPARANPPMPKSAGEAMTYYLPHVSASTWPGTSASLSIWVSVAEVNALPIAGEPGCESDSLCERAWDTLVEKAHGPWDTPDLDDYEGAGHSNDTYAGALVAVRLNDVAMRQKTIDALMSVIGTEREALAVNGGKENGMLAISRNLLRYVIAGDLLGLRADGDPNSPGTRWWDYLNYLWTAELTDDEGDSGKTFSDEPKPSCASNGCMMSAASHTALAAYLGHTAMVEADWLQLQRYLGNRSVGQELRFSSTGKNWYHDDSAKVGINPPGATCNGGYPADGVIPNDQGRGGECPTDPATAPGYTQYPWEGLQGAYAQALILERQGYSVWDASHEALLRAVQYQWYLQDRFGGEWYDDDRAAWVKHLANRQYGFRPVPYDASGGGRNMDFVQWTHPVPDTSTRLSTPSPLSSHN
ncbi:MAG: hypothetical protein M3220_03620 [Chloroflexota bacterium]|nr:hypothetical protein [Chloroflexota bacterium]